MIKILLSILIILYFTGINPAISQPLIEKGSVWKYLDDGSDQGTVWKEVEFNDDAWQSGPGILGYGTIDAGSISTTISYGPDSNNKYLTTYFRRTFDYTFAGNEKTFDFNVLADDGVVVYINGDEVFRTKMAGGAVYYDTPSESFGDESQYVTYTILAANINFSSSGSNVIAVELHQQSVTSSDVGWDIEITAPTTIAVDELIAKGSQWKYLDDGTDQETAWREVEYNDDTWQSGTGILGYGTIDAGAISTTISYGDDANNKHITTYFRKTFDYTPTGEKPNFDFNVLADDGAIIYINGDEVLRTKMPADSVYYDTPSESFGDESQYVTYTINSKDITLLPSGSNVIAVELHQQSVTSSDVGWDLQLINTNVAPITISQIRFGSTGDPLTGLTLTWKSIGDADSIAWGYSTEMEMGKFNGSRKESENIFDYTFPTLTASSTIHYALFDSKNNVWEEENTYNTASDVSSNKFSFSILGDSRTDLNQWQTVSEAVIESDFTLFTGDIINDAKVQTDWDSWFEYGDKFISRELIYHTIGNHEIDNSSTGFDTYVSKFTLPGEEVYYSFNYGNAIFIFVNTNDAGNTDQYNWLVNTLEANKDKTWKIVVEHAPFYANPGHEGEMDPYFDTLWKAFDDYGVDMIFNGHVHNYSRSKPINRNISTTSPVDSYGSDVGQGRCQIVTGGAGAPLYAASDPGLWWLDNSVREYHFCNVDIDENKLTFKAMDLNQIVFDELVLEKSTTGISELNNNELIVFPNPTTGVFHLKVPTSKMFGYRIFNSVGHLVTQAQNLRGNGNPLQIELTNQPTGIYYIEINTDKKTLVEKIILR